MSLSFLATTSPTLTNNSSFDLRPSSSKAQVSIRRQISCTSSKPKDQNENVANDLIDRRNVLIGLGGVCGATATFGNMAVGAPIQPPDLSTCRLANDLQLTNRVDCCPPYGSTPVTITDFKLPDASEPMRIRRSVEALETDPKYLAKFREAITKMRALPADDPWNFMQQAQIHCAYCNDSYSQVGFPAVNLQLHGSWHFGPWHRYYLYFWERILGKLIGDPSFAIPYWNYDQPSGMRFPSIYRDPFSSQNSLFNCNRNPDHMASLMSYRYAFGDPNPLPEEEEAVILANQKQLHDIFAENLFNPENFLGQPLSEGQVRNGPGALENLHAIPHRWTSQVYRPYWDMGNFHTAARDPIFYAHHAQIDRLWSLYKDQRGTTTPEFDQPDWLESSYIFYDENRNVVRCKVKDCLSTSALKYTYQTEDRAWLNIRRTYFNKKRAAPRSAAQDEMVAVSEFGTTPRVLDTTIRALVPRPKVSRTKDEKEEESEVIFIDDFTFDSSDTAGFEVYIARPEEGLVSADLGEFAGSFVHIPHSHGQSDQKNILHIGITYLLEDIQAEASEQLVVSLVPRSGVVTIAGISIERVSRQVV